MKILGQEWWIQATALGISLTGLYFWATGWYRLLQERYIPVMKVIQEVRKNT
jgi:hypothetical protein